MNQQFYKSLSDTSKVTDDIHELLETHNKNNRDIMAEQLKDLTRIRLSDTEKEFMKYFWHPIDQTIIKSIKFDALLYSMELKEKNYKFKCVKGQLSRTLLSLMTKNVIERNYDTDVCLTNEGVEVVILNNPKYTQLHLGYKDFVKNKIAVAITTISLVASLLSIYQWYDLSSSIKTQTPNKYEETNNLP